MSYLINQIQNVMEAIVGKSSAEICLNGLIGCGAGFLMMRFAKSSALTAGVAIIAVEVVCENSSFVVDNGSTFQKYFHMLLESLTLVEIYRRCAARGFLGGMLIGMTFA